MTLILNGTTGVSSVDGSASTPAIQGADTNTGVFFPAANTVALSTGGSERMRVDSSGNVGIGTSSPGARLHVQTSAGYNAYFQTSGTSVRINYLNDAASANVSAAYRATDFAWQKSDGAEVARIDSSGRLIVGSTASNGDGSIEGVARTNATPAVVAGSRTSGDVASAALLVTKFDNNSTTSQVFQRFAINNNAIASGQINANGASQAAFGSWSDARLKENIVDLEPQLEKVMALRPVEFDYKNGSGHQTGFLAQEMREVYPDAVGEQDGFLTMTGYGKTEARLIKAIQELTAKLDAAEARIAALEAK